MYVSFCHIVLRKLSDCMAYIGFYFNLRNYISCTINDTRHLHDKIGVKEQKKTGESTKKVHKSKEYTKNYKDI